MPQTRTDESLQRASRALRDAALAFKRAMGDDQGKDLPVPVLEALTRATDALREALAEVERTRR